MIMERAVHIGTSGWHYRHWIGPFYPPGMRSAEFLAYHARRFSAVEINGSFYRMPSAKTLAEWRDAVPAGFRFAVKAHRFITHMKKLALPITTYAWFFDDIDILAPKLGPILFQLPPTWHLNIGRLEAFLVALPRRYRYAFEFRNPTWLVPPVLALLRAHGVAFCIYDIDRFQSPIETTADFTYLRLHGPGARYQGRYGDAALREWARRIRGWAEKDQGVWCFFDNDRNGHAARDALRLKRLVAAAPRQGPTPPRRDLVQA